jgi:arylsulfatase A-like enzyme
VILTSAEGIHTNIGLFNSLILSVMAAANTSFFFTTSAEIHWRQAGGFNRDPASINTLLTGLTGLIIVEILYIVTAAVTTPYIYNIVGYIIRTWAMVLGAVFKPLINKVASRWGQGRKVVEQLKIYERVPLGDYDEEGDKTGLHGAPLLDHPRPTSAGNNQTKMWLKRALVIIPTGLIFFLRIIRPSDESYWFLSQTIVASPFAGVDSKGKLASMADHPEIDGKSTALTATPKFDWLPEGEWPGFRDWQDSKYQHYNSIEDPLHISNLDQDIIEPLRDVLAKGDVRIKHVLVFKMESTRQDVFPFKNGSYFHDRIKQSYGDEEIPNKVQKRLAHLTPTAERLTGARSGLNPEHHVKPYGGISMTNSYTAGTFTLKSIEGTTCGLSPLVVDFNHEYEHHIYQPCMPHVLDVLSANTNNSKSKDFVDWPWRPRFMQTITDTYDHQDRLTPALGFKEENILTMEDIDRQHANDTTWKAEKYNYWGYADKEMGGYLKDAILQAERKHERLFITHLTGITHHPWDLPPGVEYHEMIGSGTNSFGGKNDGLNRYLNTIGFNDRWYARVLEILEETGVANETLFILTGDHGISLLEDGNVTPYDNPLVTNFHVPLVFAHPKIPPIELNSSVTSVQILPTILDLLKESGSLDKHSTRAISDLLPVYEGQFIIRPIVEKKDDKPYWQFTVMNTGGSMVAMRSADKKYRLIVPLVPEVEWRFTDVAKDPQEEDAIKSFTLDLLISSIATRHGKEAVEWTHDAARAAQWWVRDNWRRYEFDPSS